ncbi:MAG: hypothetical protein K1060chlam2_00855 [Chlamydiae bacterium]|nr:hypothetical protein [Chlamydiota bacterium]
MLDEVVRKVERIDRIFKSTVASLLFPLFFVTFAFGSDGYTLMQKRSYEVPNSHAVRTYEDSVLDCGKDGEANFTISLPKQIPKEGLPSIIIVGGLKTGRESLQFIPDHGNYALIAYEYPSTLQNLFKINVLWNLYSVRKAALEVPPQLIAMIKYIREQPWFNNEPISLMGYSFGAVFVPVTYVRAQEQQIELGPSVMAYGGAGIYCLFKANLSLPRFLRGPVASMAAAAFKPIDPIIYAPQMRGEFLIINGKNDIQIPMECAHRLQELIPQPKTILNLETGHMHPDNTELTLRLINISRSWIEEKR